MLCLVGVAETKASDVPSVGVRVQGGSARMEDKTGPVTEP